MREGHAGEQRASPLWLKSLNTPTDTCSSCRWLYFRCKCSAYPHCFVTPVIMEIVLSTQEECRKLVIPRPGNRPQSVKAVAVFKWKMIKCTQQCSLILQSMSQKWLDLHTLGNTHVGGSTLAEFSNRADSCQKMQTRRLEHDVRAPQGCLDGRDTGQLII